MLHSDRRFRTRVIFDNLTQRSIYWEDVYARAGVTAQELMVIIADRGGGVNISKMCISLLRPTTAVGASDEGVASGRRRFHGAGDRDGGVQLEAVQIAGPEGSFQEWKVMNI